MENKKKIRVSEILLIAVVVLLGLAVLCFFVFKKSSFALFDLANSFALPTLTLGLAGDLSSFDSLAKILSVILSVFACSSILAAIVVSIVALAKKKGRAVFSALGLIVASLALVYGAALIITNIDTVTSNKLFYALLLVAGIFVALLYGTSFVALLDALRGHAFLEEAAPVAKEEKEEEKPVEEEKVEEPVKEEPAPAPVEEKVEEPVKEEPLPEPVKEEPAPEVVPEVEEDAQGGFNGRKIERVPFEDKVRRADRDLKDKYDDLKAYALSYGIKSRISVDGDSFRLHKVMYMMITIAGKKMKVYFKLDPAQFKDSPVPVRDSSEVKKYAEVPAQLDVRSELSLKRAKALLDQVMQEAGIAKEESK